ncbi:MAG: 23S rRNA (adenine(2503)-C(2))-methyltransferase RlmN [Lachnospiraceae bacterium]|nr:23S rRNA (adenine(2503)-C(2))-methyltransferase RlmN [Lachnospiraceae bacterium]
MKEAIDIKSLSLAGVTEALAALSEKPFRAGQIYEWLHARQAADFDEMTNLSLSLRARCKEVFEITVLEPVRVLSSRLDGTRKFLFRLKDGNVIESVFMPYHYGNSVCISSQVGCRMGCRFCASTLDGLVRGLEVSEMLDQVYRIGKITGERISHVVVMGSGEPLDNYENLVGFLKCITDGKGFGLSARNITISTCGLVPQMYRFAEEGIPVTLALSLHASGDETRRELMPVARKYSLEEVLKACDYYFEKTGRRISFEYSLVHGVNDTPGEAEELRRLLKGKNCHVNLIPVNPIKERDFRRGSGAEIVNFKNILEKSGINVTIRREMGRDIEGACGQLRRSFQSEASSVP